MKVKGSTLIESLVALVIIMMVISISLNVLVSNSRTSSKELTLKSMILIDEVLQEAKRNGNYDSDQFEQDGISIDKSVSFVNRYEGILKIKVKAMTMDRELIEKEEFIYLK